MFDLASIKLQNVKRLTTEAREAGEEFFASRQGGVLFLFSLPLVIGGCVFFLSARFVPFIDYFFVWWILAVLVLKLKGRVSVAAGVLFLSICPWALFIDQVSLAENSATLAYSLFLIGTIQLLIKEVWHGFPRS